MSFYTNVAELVRGVDEEGLEDVWLSWGVRLSEAEVEAIARAVERTGRIRVLMLGNNQISDVGATRLAEALSTCTLLTKLHLQGNQITDAGAIKLQLASWRAPAIAAPPNGTQANFFRWGRGEGSK